MEAACNAWLKRAIRSPFPSSVPPARSPLARGGVRVALAAREVLQAQRARRFGGKPQTLRGELDRANLERAWGNGLRLRRLVALASARASATEPSERN